METLPVFDIVSEGAGELVERRKAWVRASVLDMESEKTSEAVIIVKGTSVPSVCAIPITRKHSVYTLYYIT